MNRNQRMVLQNLGYTAVFAILGIYASTVTGQQINKESKSVPKEAMPEAVSRAEASTSPEEIKIFWLKYGNAREIAKLLRDTIENIRVTVDARTNSIVFSGTEEKGRIAQALLEKLDHSAPDNQALSPVDVRIIWLAEGDASAAKPADDLKGVVEELRRLGLHEVGQVAQALVKSSLGGRTFRISCLPLLEGKPTQLRADGAIREGMIEIHISATRYGETTEAVSRNKPPEKLAEIDLSTVFKENQYIVLGVAPIGKYTSVFVIQVLPSADKRSPGPTRR
jgi:hypothetical protein